MLNYSMVRLSSVPSGFSDLRILCAMRANVPLQTKSPWAGEEFSCNRKLEPDGELTPSTATCGQFPTMNLIDRCYKEGTSTYMGFRMRHESQCAFTN